MPFTERGFRLGDGDTPDREPAPRPILLRDDFDPQPAADLMNMSKMAESWSIEVDEARCLLAETKEGLRCMLPRIQRFIHEATIVTSFDQPSKSAIGDIGYRFAELKAEVGKRLRS